VSANTDHPRKAVWIEWIVVAVISSLATLMAVAAFRYYHEQNRKIYPGNDFPARWVGRDILGASYDSYESTEQSKRQSELSIMQFHYRNWCEANGVTPRDVKDLR